MVSGSEVCALPVNCSLVCSVMTPMSCQAALSTMKYDRLSTVKDDQLATVKDDQLSTVKDDQQTHVR